MHRDKHKKGGPFIWSSEEEAIIVKLLQQRMPLMDIGNRFGCGYRPIKRIADLHGITFAKNTHGKRMTPEAKTAILSALKAGHTLDQTAALVDYPKSAVEKIANKHKIKVTRKRRDNHFDEQTEQDIVSLIRQRIPLVTIAQRYQCNPDTLSRVAKRHGIKPNAPKDDTRRHISTECATSMCQAYQAGATLDDLATRYRASVPVIRRTLTKQGVDIRPCFTPKAIEDTIAIDYTHGGLTIIAIQDKHGVTGKVVRRIVRERHLERVNPAIPRPRKPRRSFYETWTERYGKEGADRRREEHRALCSKNSSGVNNPMYGKPTPQGSGNGWKGWYKGHFFRSLRELTFMLELETRQVQWQNGEKKEYRVRYVDHEGTERTYAPDFIVAKEAMYEIKPKRLWNSPLVTAKRLAAEVLCKQLGIEYRLVDPTLDEGKLLEVHKSGEIKWWGKCEERFLNYYGLARAA